MSVLGAGPQSTVYKATDLLGADAVALKLIAPTAARDNAVVSQYRMDLNMFRQAQHPGLVRILDFGDFLGRIYVAMELVEGETLREQMRSGRKLPLDHFELFFAQVSNALGELHARHLAHRDLHPRNVMLTPSGSWKLMEPGIGRDQRRARSSEDAAYAAPEQLRGQPATPASDIYALGALAYLILAGNPLAGGRRGARPVESDIEGAPAGLGPLIETCTQVDPAKRFPNAQALESEGKRIFAANRSKTVVRRLEEFRTPAPARAEEMIPVFTRVVRGLIALHASGREHAELSPGNIRVSGDTVEFETGSKASPPSSGAATLLISDAKYTAPELILARTAPDLAAHACGDVYVLGFVFYELLAGGAQMQREFGDVEQMQTGLAWMRWHADPKTKLWPLAETLPDCPKGLADLIDGMTQKDPAQRVRTLEEVAERLGKLTFGLARTQPYAISSTPTPKRRRQKTAVVAVGSAVIALVAIAMAARYFSRRSNAPAGASRAWAAAKARFGGSAAGGGSTLPASIETATGDMVLVPAGEFLMGNTGANPAGARPVNVPAFYIDRLEVTNQEYRTHSTRAGRPLPEAPSWDAEYFSKGDYPVVNVDREAASAFCESAGKRLPREEEWEKAAGGAEAPGVVWGNWTLPGLANLRLDGRERPARAGSFAADVSRFGVFDAGGNVQEWVAGDSPDGGGIVKGGSFATSAQDLSPAWRGSTPLKDGGRDLSSVGFRCAVDAQAALRLARSAQVASASRPSGWIRTILRRN